MVDKIFEKTLLNSVFENSLSSKKLLEASEIYLNNQIELLDKDNNVIVYKINDMVLNISFNNYNKIEVYKDNSIYYIDEYVIACLMDFKRQHYITNEILFMLSDIQLNAYYYNNYFISNIYYEQYQARFNFYYGLIDKLYELELYEHCIKVLVDFFGTLDTRFSYENKYLENEKYNLFRIIKDKYNLLYEYPHLIIESFGLNKYPITTIGKLLYVSGVNKPSILKNNSLIKLYEHVFDNYLPFLKTTQLFRDLKRQYSIIKWFNKELDDSFMEQNISSYDVMCCYITYLYDLEEYKKITSVFKLNKVITINNELIYKVIDSFYKCMMYDDALSIIKLIKNFTFETYIKYKKDFLYLFEGTNLEIIIEGLVDTCNEDEFDKILKYEDLDEYKILVYAKKDFKLVDDKFNEYNGKYDKQLLKIYQKEIYNDLMSIRGYYSRVPFEIEQKIEKLSKIKNGVYYIYELLIEIKKKVYLSFIDDLVEYCCSLEV